MARGGLAQLLGVATPRRRAQPVPLVLERPGWQVYPPAGAEPARPVHGHPARPHPRQRTDRGDPLRRPPTHRAHPTAPPPPHTPASALTAETGSAAPSRSPGIHATSSPGPAHCAPIAHNAAPGPTSTNVSAPAARRP